MTHEEINDGERIVMSEPREYWIMNNGEWTTANAPGDKGYMYAKIPLPTLEPIRVIEFSAYEALQSKLAEAERFQTLYKDASIEIDRKRALIVGYCEKIQALESEIETQSGVIKSLQAKALKLHDAAIERDNLKSETEILRSKASQFESTVLATVKSRDALKSEIEQLKNKLTCNHTFHRLGGFDDCPECNPKELLSERDALKSKVQALEADNKQWKSSCEAQGNAYAELKTEIDTLKAQLINRDEVVGRLKKCAEFYRKEDNLYIDCDDDGNGFISEKSEESIYNELGFVANETLAECEALEGKS